MVIDWSSASYLINYPNLYHGPFELTQLLGLSVRMRHFSRVYRPCMEFAAAHLALPSGFLVHVEDPPCVLHKCLPRIATFRECSALRLKRAWHPGVCTAPKTLV